MQSALSGGDAGSAFPAQWSALSQHPHFAAAAQRLAANMLIACDEDEQLCATFKDAGRYLTAMFAAYLHGAGGLTLPLLESICAGSGFMSPGRARALLQFLLHVGFIQPAPGASRPLAYLPTPRFMLAWRRHLELALMAAAVMEPAVEPLLERFADPGVFETFLATQAYRLHDATLTLPHHTHVEVAFLHPYAGSQILWALIVTGRQGDFPGDGPIPVVKAQLARRFGVTPVQIRRVIAGAQAHGLLRDAGRGTIVFEALGKAEVRHFYAFQLAELIANAEMTLAALP